MYEMKGKLAEWSIAVVLKTTGVNSLQAFESLTFRIMKREFDFLLLLSLENLMNV